MITRRQRSFVVTTAVATIVAAAASSNGAYFSQSWGWVALAFLMPTTILMILGRVSAPGTIRIAFASLVGTLGVWIALSTLWSLSPSGSAREVERALVYVGLALAVALVLRRGDGSAVGAGALVAIAGVSAYGLATRLYPERLDTVDDPFNTYRLAEPVGYWNATGLLATLGILLAFGFVAHARSWPASLAAAATLPPLASTLYFTFSRGAWAALVIGSVATVLADPRRLRFVWMCAISSIPSIVCVAYGSRLDALTTMDAPGAAASLEGRRMAYVVLGAGAASLGACALGRLIAGRLNPGVWRRRVFDVSLAGLGFGVVVIALLAMGGPSTAWNEIRDRFNAEVVGAADLNERLFSVSGNGRSEQLRVAFDAGLDEPILGNGSGTFEYLWYERRPTLLVVRDGHSLYMETFAELGVVGLTLLVAALLIPLVAAVRARRRRFVGSAVGAYVAWLAASTFDWHWEMVGLTMTALLAGAVCLVSAERKAGVGLLAGTRLMLVGVTGTLSVLAVWSLVGNQALFAGLDAASRKDWAHAREDGVRARSLLTWSHEPHLLVGRAESGLGDREASREAFREAVDKDMRNWLAWLYLAQVERGAARDAAYDRVRELNPREEDLPGE